MGSRDVTVTRHRGLKAFHKLIQETEELHKDTVTNPEKQKEEDLKLRIGKVQRFYPRHRQSTNPIQ